jgi:hypothetical protein
MHQSSRLSNDCTGRAGWFATLGAERWPPPEADGFLRSPLVDRDADADDDNEEEEEEDDDDEDFSLKSTLFFFGGGAA